MTIAAVYPELEDDEESPWSLVHWWSGHLRRVVESTLGSETQALVVGLKELEWVSCLRLELRLQVAALTRLEVRLLELVQGLLVGADDLDFGLVMVLERSSGRSRGSRRV